MDERFCDVGRGITLCYETFGERSDPTALLIMGLGTQMVAWNEDFLPSRSPRAGFHVVRFDKPRRRTFDARARGAADDHTAADALATRGPLQARRHGRGRSGPAVRARARARARDRRVDGRDDRADARRAPSAQRALARLDHVQHRTAAERPAPRCGSTRFFLRRPAAGRAQYIAHFERPVRRRSDRPGCRRDPEEIRALAAISYDRDHDAAGPGRQLAAIHRLRRPQRPSCARSSLRRSSCTARPTRSSASPAGAPRRARSAGRS